MTSEKKLQEIVDRVMANAFQAVQQLLSVGESPIEKLFIASLIENFWVEPRTAEHIEIVNGGRYVEWLGSGGTILISDIDQAGIYVLQPTLVVEGRKMRLDAAVFGGGQRCAVEFDGHDFHERTKDQAKRDKSRDRALTRAGWKVLRFTGSEVWADPGAVFEEIDNFRGDAEFAEYEADYAKYVAGRAATK